MENTFYDITMRVYVRAPEGRELPTQRSVEDMISSLLLAMPRLEEGAPWDVSATSLPETGARPRKEK